MKGLSFGVSMALVFMAGTISAQVPSSWQTREVLPYDVSDAADVVFVQRPESTFVFAYNVDEAHNSYFNAYRPQSGDWSGDLASPPYSAYRFAMAYSPAAMRIYAIGSFPDGDPRRLYAYAFDSPYGSAGTWTYETYTFDTDQGTRMVYRPNRYYSPLHAIPGWLYVTGQENTYHKLYRYSIPNPGDAAVMGYNPGNTAEIADATPHFVWPSVENAIEYRIQISNGPAFDTAEIDEFTPMPEFQTPDTQRLARGTQYWRTQSRVASGVWTTGAVSQFTLQDGWDDGVPCPWDQTPQEGACLVYTSTGSGWPGKTESLWAADGHNNTNFWCYSIHSGTWTSAPTLPLSSTNARMASNPNPVYDPSELIYAVLDDPLNQAGKHYYLDLRVSPLSWQEIVDAPFPAEPSSRGRLVYDPVNESLYATLGAPSGTFYARYAGVVGGGARLDGPQAGSDSRKGSGLRVCRSGDGFRVRYALPTPELAKLDIYDPTGRKVFSRAMGSQTAGEHAERFTTTELRARGVSPHGGIFLLRLSHGRMIEHAKVVLF